jgi:hypothetical protein
MSVISAIFRRKLSSKRKFAANRFGTIMNKYANNSRHCFKWTALGQF